MKCDNTNCLKDIRYGEVWGTSLRVYCSSRCRDVVENPKPLSGSTVACVVGILAAFLLTFAFTHKARAHNPVTHQADNLSEAYSEAYGRCCSGDDYQYVRVQDWETTATGYRVLYKGKWLEAPRSAKVKNIPNPDGEAKVWVFNDEAPYIRCFMPGSLSAYEKPQTTKYV